MSVTFPRGVSREDFLTIEDVEELPNGMATIVRVAKFDGTQQTHARIDKRGCLRTIDEREYFARDWDVVGTGWSP